MLAALLFTLPRRAWAAVRATGGYGILSGAMWAIMFVAFMLALMTTTTANTLDRQQHRAADHGAAGARRAARADRAAHLGSDRARHRGHAVDVRLDFAGGEPRHLAGMLIALAVPLAAAVNPVTL